MKFLNLQTLIHGYMCMGHGAQFGSTSSTSGPEKRKRDAHVVKVIKSDGVVDIYRKPIRALELMHQFPDHLVCHSHSFFIGRKIPPVSPKHKLQLGHTYFVLPLHLFQTVLSFVTVASSFSSLNNNSNNSGPSKAFLLGTCQVFEIRKAPSGSLQVRVSDEFVSKLIQQEKKIEDIVKIQYSAETPTICTTSELQRDYTQLVSYRQWKPKLETIKESKKNKLSFGIKRRNKKSSQPSSSKTKSSKTPKSKQPDHHRTKCPKIKVKARKIKLADSALT